MEKNIAIIPAFGGGSRSDVSITLRPYFAILKQSGGRAKDKIDSAFDITVLVILTAVFAVSIERVLKTQKAAVLKHCPVTAHKNGYSLPYRAGCILESNVLGVKIRSIHIKTRGTGGRFSFTKTIQLLCVIIVGQNGVFDAFANKTDINLAFG